MKSFAHLILALVVSVLSLGGLSIWYASIAAKSAAVTSLQNQIDARTQAANRLASARSTLLSLTTDETRIQNYFVPEASVVAFIDSLEVRGRALGTAVNVSSVTTGGTTAKPTLDFTLTVRGTFDGVLRTIGDIEYAPYAIVPAALSLEELEKNSWQAVLVMHVGSRSVQSQNPKP